MAYMECPECGHRALSIATRCPHCGIAFAGRLPGRAAPSSHFDRIRPSLAVGVLVVGLAVVVILRRPGTRAEETASLRRPASVQPMLPQESGSTLQRSALAAETAQPPVAGRETEAGRRVATRYARTWVNVRYERGRRSPVVRVLNPGDAVQVDSLRRGWYRVVANGRTAGYAHRSNLDPVPPPKGPVP